MAEIYTFTPKQKTTEENVELNRLRARLLDLYEIRDTLNKEIRFTKDAIKYALCSDLTLIGWDYPETGSLKQMIDSSGLYPITCLTSLTTGEKQKLLSVNIVLCKELIDKKNNLNELSISSDRIEIITKECINLCTPPNE